MRISGKIGATAAVLLAACGGGQQAVPIDPNATPLAPPQLLDRVFILQSYGSPVADTVVTFASGEQRVVVLRRAPPDNNLFARLVFPAGSVSPARGDSVTLRISVPPDLYGLVLDTDAAFTRGAEVTFSYAMHFVAPEGARQSYGTDLRFERFLGVGRLRQDSMLVFLDSWRPASDVLTAPLVGPGQYLVAAPQSRPAFKSIVW